ncbi:universal stress protein [Nonomuraea sp. B12E4]|uniref:universal stress protein n=1 Tax=Nonomuraea sp. B12E4 TaxID=3153564 RepID=UPI00325E34A5
MMAGHIVVGVDGPAPVTAAVEWASIDAQRRGLAVRIVHVVSACQGPALPPYTVDYSSLAGEAMREDNRAAREGVTPWRERNPDIVITDDQPCEHPVIALVDAARTADLVVVGSRGLGGFASAVLGSVSRGVLHHVNCPVAVVRSRAKEES